MGSRFADGAALSIPDTIVRNTYIANFEAIQVAMLGTQLFGVRPATLAMAVPPFALVYSVALTDGLVQRAIRACARREGIREPLPPCQTPSEGQRFASLLRADGSMTL